MFDARQPLVTSKPPAAIDLRPEFRLDFEQIRFPGRHGKILVLL